MDKKIFQTGDCMVLLLSLESINLNTQLWKKAPFGTLNQTSKKKWGTQKKKEKYQKINVKVFCPYRLTNNAWRTGQSGTDHQNRHSWFSTNLATAIAKDLMQRYPDVVGNINIDCSSSPKKPFQTDGLC